VLAAGLGTRMQSARAKVLHELAGRPLIAYPLTALRRIGVDPIVVVVGYQADAVRAACTPYAVRFALQAEQKGTGHAVQMAHSALRNFAGDLVLVYGDLPLLRRESFERLIAAHHAAQASVSLLTETVDSPAGFGRIVRDAQGHVARIVEDRDATDTQRAIREINVGAYVADAAFLFSALTQLEPANAQAELYLTDIIAVARDAGKRIGDAPASPGESVQISSRADLAAREKTLRDTITQQWMANGVTLEDPATAYIGPDVLIGRDTVLGPNVMLRGTTRIGANCRFDGNALIADTTIGDNVHVKFGVVMSGATVEDEGVVGPFAQLRPGTHLGRGVHIGDFVETKNAVLGAGSKANHHAYLGDTEIGRDVNIGAGTITCNYDGVRKWRTTIGDRVQVGSDSQLVAPITIGDDAYIATGTTVRKDVPPGALVFNTKPQLHRTGWVAAWRARQQPAAASTAAAPAKSSPSAARPRDQSTGRKRPTGARRSVRAKKRTVRR
jgi:bifunctional UDP-N-acetylglucosamine pyrophosphorylase / glucosamine-1-phosphate N-acetyltransferase